MSSIAMDSPAATASEQSDALGRFADMMERALDAFAAAPEYAELPMLMAEALKADPRGAELALRDRVLALARGIEGGALERLDDHGPSVVVGGVRHWRAAKTPGRAATLFGPVTFRRSRYRPPGGGEAVFPTEALVGIAEGGMTPAAAEMSLYLTGCLTARESEEAWRRMVGEGLGPSASSLSRLTTAEGGRWQEIEAEELEAMRERETIPDKARAVQVMLDGVMMRMRAETGGDEPQPAGWKEASTGVVQVVGEDAGDIMSARYFGRVPEAGKPGLKRQLWNEVWHLLGRRPDLKVVAIADAAQDNWAFLEKLNPDCCLIDFWHSCAHLKACADDAFGRDSEEGDAWFENCRDILRDDPKGIGRTIEAIRHLVRSGRGGEDLERELRFFRKNRKRMGYRAASDAGYSIGSGAVESSNKNLVQQRMKRCGQRWGKEGGQSVLSFRSLAKSGRFDAACRSLLRHRRANAPVKPPAAAPQLALAA